MDQFVCWGPRCPATCCHVPWQINVDDETLARWQQLPKDECQALMDSTEALFVSDRKHTVFRKNADDRCIHFREDRLCALHARHGFDNLSDTCRNYPRVDLVTGWKTASAIYLSCPAAVTLLTDVPADIPLIVHDALDMPAEQIDPIAAALDAWTQHLLTLDQFAISVRLVYIALTLERLASLATQNALTAERVNELLAPNTTRMANDLGELDHALSAGRLSADPVVTGKFWHFVFKASEKTFDRRKPDNALATTIVRRLAGMDDQQGLAAGAEIHAQIEQLGEALRPKLAPYQHVLRNYLAGLFLVYGFPWKPKAGNYIATFFRAVVSYAATQLYLRLYTADSKELTAATIAEAIYQVEHSLGHHERIYHVLERNPSMLRVGQYAACFASLG